MKRFAALTAVVVAAATLLPAYAAEDCTATFEVSLVRQENSLLEFEVEVTSDATRARVEYIFDVTVANSSGESKTIPVARTVDINDTTSNEFVTHTLESGESLVSYDARMVSCRTKP